MKNRIQIGIVCIFLVVLGTQAVCRAKTEILVQRAELGAARVRVTSSMIEVSTGEVQRKWEWSGGGWATMSFKDLVRGVEYIKEPVYRCDWTMPGQGVDEDSSAEQAGCTIKVDDDEGFSSEHLEVVSRIRYPKARLEFQYVIWVYSGAPGIRTQLRVKALDGFAVNEKVTVDDVVYKSYGGTLVRPGARTEYLGLDLAKANQRFYWGYYNDPGNRLDQSKPMLKEEWVRGYPVFQNEVNGWASGMVVDYDGRGVAIVKESPKTVNQPAYRTGSFFVNSGGVEVTGWGLASRELVTDRFRDCWATWSMVYAGGNDGLQLTVKRFDAIRYPVFPERDMFILSNTWGPGNPGGSQFASEDFVLKEIPAVGELGIDVMQIDDGWQKAGRGPSAASFMPKYTNGWADIKAAADRAGVRLGLWVAIRNADLEHMKTAIDELGFVSWKADYDRLTCRSDYEKRLALYRAVTKHSWMKTQFTLCPEYDDPRYGWYFAKEYGSIYFQNIQEGLPKHLTMVPYQVLKKLWQMATYFPANKLQVLLQNPKRVRQDVSDARQHGHGYCFAMGLPFVPVFFQSAQFLDDAGKAELKELIRVYKRYREDMFGSITFPIGQEPDNRSWSGFQLISREREGGFLLLFRELHNEEVHKRVRLKFMAGKRIRIENVQRAGEARTVLAGDDGEVEFQIDQPADFLFLRYAIGEH